MLDNLDNKKEVVFNKCRPKTFLQVLFRGLRQWVGLQRCDIIKDQLLFAG